MIRAQLPGRDRVGTSRFETFLRRLLSVKGVVAPDIEPRISPGIELTRPPWEFAGDALLMGWRGWECYFNVGPVAAQYGFVNLVPPVTGMMCVVEFVSFYAVVSQVVTIGVRDVRAAGAGAITNFGPMDNRVGSISSIVAVPSFLPFQGANVTVPGTLGNTYYVQANTTSMILPGPWVVVANGNTVPTFQVLGQNVNTGLYGTIRWWERAIEPSEVR